MELYPLPYTEKILEELNINDKNKALELSEEDMGFVFVK
jgi:hypothetical protein